MDPLARRLLGVVGAALVLVLSGLAWRQFTPTTSPPADAAVRQRPLTSLPGAEFDPALSPRGNQVAFAWFHDDRYGLYVKHLDTEAARPGRRMDATLPSSVLPTLVATS